MMKTNEEVDPSFKCEDLCDAVAYLYKKDPITGIVHTVRTPHPSVYPYERPLYWVNDRISSFNDKTLTKQTNIYTEMLELIAGVAGN